MVLGGGDVGGGSVDLSSRLCDHAAGVGVGGGAPVVLGLVFAVYRSARKCKDFFCSFHITGGHSSQDLP